MIILLVATLCKSGRAERMLKKKKTRMAVMFEFCQATMRGCEG